MRAELKRSEMLVKKLQETATLQGQNQNNTSSTFTLPSEFKKSWEELVQETLLDVFSPFFEQHCLLVWLVRDVTELVYDYVMQELDRKVSSLLSLFVLDPVQKDSVKKSFLRMFQDNCTKMIPLTDDSFSQLRLSFERRTRAYIAPKQRSSLVTVLESSDFKEFIGKWLKLCLHMVLSEPRITVTFAKQLEYSVLSRPEDYYCIDGFPKGNPKCVVVLPPPVRHGTPYQAIKPAVLILAKDQPELSLDEQQSFLLKSEEDGDSMEMTSPLVSEPLPPHVPPLTMDGLPDNEDSRSDQPETPLSILKGKQSTYAQRYEQKMTLSKSPFARKASPQHKEGDTMALVNRFKSLKQYESKAKATNKLTEEDEDSRYSTMPLQVRKPLSRGEKLGKQVPMQPSLESTLKARKSFDEMPTSTQRYRPKDGLCLHCRSKLPCHRCEGLRTVDSGYSKPSRAHSSSVLDPDPTPKPDSIPQTTLMKKRMESAKRAIRQNEPNRPPGKETCKVM